MARPLVVSYGKDLIKKAKSLDVHPQMFINRNVEHLAVKYRKMAPIIVARRMEKYASAPMDDESKTELDGCISDLNTAHEHNITTGEFRMIKLGVKQKDGKIRGIVAAYILYQYEGKPVVDLALIDIAEERTVDTTAVLTWGALALLTAIFIPRLGFHELGSVLGTAATGLSALAEKKNQTTKENIEALLLKTLEHYGLIRFVSENQIELITD